MRSAAALTPFGILLGGALLLPPEASRAGDGEAAFPPPERRIESLHQQRLTQEWYEAQLARAFERLRPKPDRKVLLGLEDTGAEEKGFVRSHFRLNLKRGLEYRQEVPVGDRRLRLKLYGPIVKKNPGLQLKLDGLSVGAHPLEIQAFGNPEKGGVEFKIEF